MRLRDGRLREPLALSGGFLELECNTHFWPRFLDVHTCTVVKAPPPAETLQFCGVLILPNPGEGALRASGGHAEGSSYVLCRFYAFSSGASNATKERARAQDTPNGAAGTRKGVAGEPKGVAGTPKGVGG